MRFSILCCMLTGFAAWGYSQESENYIPKEAVTVFTINNFSLLQKISLDELVKYEFMEEIHQEIFDGSTSGKTIKDSGIDFNRKLNVFYGRNFDFEVSGFTFGIKDKAQLFDVFDDFKVSEKTSYPGVEVYESYFNRLYIKDGIGILLRVEPNYERVTELTDSIWYANGNDIPWDIYDEYEEFDETEYQIDEVEEIEEYYEESLYEEEVEITTEQEQVIFPEAEEVTSMNYYEMLDSVEYALSAVYLKEVEENLLVKGLNLKSEDLRFAGRMNNASDGIFYMDNSRNINRNQNLWYMHTMFPSLYTNLEELYKENVIFGDIVLNENNVVCDMKTQYGESLGSIYEKMNSAKFDKDMLKYIPENCPAYFTYTINLREAYEQAYKVMMPLLEQERNPNISASILTLELLNELINKDALFDAYKGGMFGTFNGIEKIKTKKIEFIYDENTFEYEEREVEAEEDMPIFALGFSTERSDIPEKIMRHLSRLSSRFQNMGEYWMVENGVLDAAPLYILNRNGLLVFTNDRDLAVYNPDGYKKALSKKETKAIKKSGFMYAKVDWGATLNEVPRDIFVGKENEILDAMRGKTGTITLTTSPTTKQKTDFKIVYDTSSGDNSSKYILDLINSIYVISR